MLSADQCRSLRCLAEMMIPASTEYDVPSAGDEAIFGEILRNLQRDADPVTAVLQMLDADGPFADIDPQRRDAIAARLRETGGGALAYLTRIFCNATTKRIGSCDRSAWNRGRRFLKASKSNKATGLCWIRYAGVRSFIATRIDSDRLRDGNDRSRAVDRRD